MRRLSPRLPDILGGLTVVLVGGYVVWEGASYSMGSLTRMGPGFFPVLLGTLFVALGAAVMLLGMVREEPEDAPRPPWRALLWISLGVTSFALTIDGYGLIPATFLLVLLSSIADRFRPLTAALTAAVLSAAGVLVFIFGLGLPMPIFRLF